MNLVRTLVRLSRYLFFKIIPQKRYLIFQNGASFCRAYTPQKIQKKKKGTFFTKMVPFLPKWYLKKGTFFGVSCPKKVTFFKMRLIIPTTHKKKQFLRDTLFCSKRYVFEEKVPFFEYRKRYLFFPKTRTKVLTGEILRFAEDLNAQIKWITLYILELICQ